MSIIAVKNLPGALEIALLSRLHLAPGTGYAITTVLKYTIAFFSILAASKLLGADWSKLQWLIAALGVGLGFGLQEIVGNFVSGIIILFEKPFRLGDTVTIAGQSGTVSRIRIRATTISDLDRKEHIIPNKAFLTQDFTNWTLTDPITRLIISVGVAYGSDPEQVVDILLDVARRNAKVLDEPPPAALLLSFGDNSLNFELRIFTHSILDRIVGAHELHLAIDKAFREHGIEISFPQRDIHLDSTSPLEVVLKSSDRKPS
jgi:potassium efflux system protein